MVKKSKNPTTSVLIRLLIPINKLFQKIKKIIRKQNLLYTMMMKKNQKNMNFY